MRLRKDERKSCPNKQATSQVHVDDCVAARLQVCFPAFYFCTTMECTGIPLDLAPTSDSYPKEFAAPLVFARQQLRSFLTKSFIGLGLYTRL